MFKITTPPVDHVSLKRMSRNFQKEAHTDDLRGPPEERADLLVAPTRQAAVPTEGTSQPAKTAQNFPLTLVDVINYTASALEAKPTIFM